MDESRETTRFGTGAPNSAAHWTDEELLDLLYGVGPEDPDRRRHLAECERCRLQWDAWQASHRQVAVAPEIRETFLTAQRGRIYRRIGQSHGGSWVASLAPALATLALLLLAIVLHRPAPLPAVEQRAESDGQFFAEVYEDVYRTEPKGLETIHALFEEAQ